MNHEYYMQQALEQARLGWPKVAPNPMVGSVIVKNNEIISSGYHQKFGEAHAEVNAIANLPSTVLPAECTLYVTLEPCSHYGKTPPCADLIIAKGFKNVVVGCKDPNPLVAGRGILKLESAGIKVISGVLEKEVRAQNKRFIRFFEEKRPYYIMKWAITADGYISKFPVPKIREENYITHRDAQVYVHEMRSEVMGIFVGKHTVLNDNPHLTTRLVKGENPVRIFIDRNLEVSRDFNIYNQDAKTIVFNAKKNAVESNIQFIKLNFEDDILSQVNAKLYEQQIQSVLVEGGAFLINEFLKNDLWDEVLVFQNPDLYFREGLKAPVFALKNTFDLVGSDKLYHHFRHESLTANGAFEKEIF
ncbi:riboflavin biosynthesis protein RibD [Sphingobacteriaceae bacterium]|nr:riboflavin biosynthesis protein RibD [Sphingobacteriaceae bacterium]